MGIFYYKKIWIIYWNKIWFHPFLFQFYKIYLFQLENNIYWDNINCPRGSDSHWPPPQYRARDEFGRSTKWRNSYICSYNLLSRKSSRAFFLFFNFSSFHLHNTDFAMLLIWRVTWLQYCMQSIIGWLQLSFIYVHSDLTSFFTSLHVLLTARELSYY